MNLEQIEYEPEVFPGLVNRVRDPFAVVLDFGSGALVVAGTRAGDDAALVVVVLQSAIDRIGAWVPA